MSQNIFLRLPLENIINCRELGGYPCNNGEATKFGRFLRCGIPTTPTENDVERLRAHGVKTVIDLRGNMEADITPSIFKNLEDFTYHHFTTFDLNVAGDEEQDSLSLADTYIQSVEDYKKAYKNIFSAIANAPDGAILFHCFIGKDRTGMLSAMLLEIAGVGKEDIIANYQLSYTYLRKFLMKHLYAMDDNVTLSEKDLDKHHSDPETIDTLLNHIQQKYAGVKAYLQSIGVSDEEIEKVKSRLI